LKQAVWHQQAIALLFPTTFIRRTSSMATDKYEKCPPPRQPSRGRNVDGRCIPSLCQAITYQKSSHKFHCRRFLAYDDTLEDGFCIRFPSEFLVIDARADPAVRRLLNDVKTRMEDEADLCLKVLIASAAVAAACGGTEGVMESRFLARFQELGLRSMEPYHIGSLFGHSDLLGVGLCRHRSLLLKYMLDMLDVCPSAVLDGVISSTGAPHDAGAMRKSSQAVDHMWNVVDVEGQSFLCDVLNNPETLLHIPVEAQSREHEGNEGDPQAGARQLRKELAFSVGAEVEIWSRTAGGWKPGEVVSLDSRGLITVEFEIDNKRAQKSCREGCRELRSLQTEPIVFSYAEHDPGGAIVPNGTRMPAVPPGPRCWTPRSWKAPPPPPLGVLPPSRKRPPAPPPLGVLPPSRKG